MSTASVSQSAPLPEQPRRKPKPKPTSKVPKENLAATSPDIGLTETDAERYEAHRVRERDRHRQRKAAETKAQRKKRLAKTKRERQQLRQRLISEDPDAVFTLEEFAAAI